MQSSRRQLTMMLLAAVMAAGMVVPAFAQDLLVTGQTSAFTANKNDGIPGQVAVEDDGTLQLGLPLQYVDTGLTIIDLNTGLEWEKKNSKDNVQNPANLHDADNVYLWSGNGTQETIWDWLDDLNAEQFAGYSDWRIPNIRELKSIVHFRQDTPAIDPIFGATATHYNWSSTTDQVAKPQAWGVNFGNGTAGAGDKTIAKWVRAVRTAVANQPPVAQANGPYSGQVGSAISFSSAGSTDPDGSIDSYSWDFGDGSPPSTQPDPSHTYTSAGSFTATLTVTDNQGATDTDTAEVTVDNPPPVNQPPVAEANGPYSGEAGSPITFSSAGSNDPDGTITVYSWDFGDGSPPSTEQNPSHTYTSAGDFTATLTVTDNQGATDTDTAAVTVTVVANQPPVAEANGPYSGQAGSPISFSSADSNDPDGTIATYSWDFGDGSAPSTAPDPSHTYTSAGDFTATLTVTDNQGATGTDTAAVTVTVVANQPPVAEANGPYSGQAGSPITFSSAGSNDPDGTIATYSWDFGDGTPPSTEQNPSHTYASAGDFTATLTVTDNQGATDTDTAPVTVAQVQVSDLVETTVTNPPGSIKRGKRFSVTDTAQNQGTATAGASTTRYYLSLDTLKDSGDKLLTGSRAVPSLAPGAQSSGTLNVTVPTTTALGSYFLLACADDTQVVAENNETNNCKASATQVTVNP